MKILTPALVAAAALAAAAFVRPAPTLTAGAEYVVARAPFVESIVEAGTVAAARMALYGAPLGALPSKIVEIAPEGSAVEAGDLLVRLDTAPLEQLLARESAALRRAEADLAEERNARRLESRTGALQLMEAEAALSDAEREMARARMAVEDFRPMLAEGFITRPEFERAEQALKRAEEQRRLAAARRDLRAGAVSHDAGKSGGTSPSQASALVDEIRLRIAALQQQMALSTIRAGSPGLVVYRELFFGSERRKPQVGDEALPNQPLIAIPDASALIVETRVREIDLHRVTSSQRVLVRVDAYPDLEVEGTVDVVGALAHADASSAGIRYFPLSIRLDRSDPRLRSGMTAQVRIEVATIASATVVPISAVLEDADGTYCLVSSGGATGRRSVTVWARNETLAAIKAGLTAGERIRLAPGPR